MFYTLPWRQYPAWLLIILGLALTIYALRRMPNPTKPKLDLVHWMRGFRQIVTGVALFLFGIAWLQHLPWLLAIAIFAGLQEIRESTSYLLTLDKARRWTTPRRAPAPH